MRLSRASLAGVVLALTAAAAAWGGGTVVFFVDGRSLIVESVERLDGAALLYLEGGGALSVPVERVSNWEDLPEGPAAAAPAGETPGGAPWRGAAGKYAELFARAAAEHDVDPALLTAMAEVESAFDPRAVSPKGACGLLQLMPDTAQRFGVQDVFDAGQNVSGGARYLSWLLERFDGRMELALAGYNAGEGAVDRYQGVPPYRETRMYVRRVMDGAARLAVLAP